MPDMTVEQARAVLERSEHFLCLRELAGEAVQKATEAGTPPRDFYEAAILLHLAAEVLPPRFIAAAHLMIRAAVLEHVQEYGAAEDPLSELLELLKWHLESGPAAGALTFQEQHWYETTPGGLLGRLVPNNELTALVTGTWPGRSDF